MPSIDRSMADQLIQDYTVDIDTTLANMPPMERRFDTRLGAKLYADAPIAIQDLLIDKEKRRYQDQDSFLQMVKSIALRINFKSEERTISLLRTFINETKPCQDPRKLSEELATFATTYGIFSKLSSVNCGTVYMSEMGNTNKSTYISRFKTMYGF